MGGAPFHLQPVSKAAAAYQRLRHEIRSGELRPGERVTLKRLSGMLEMSLTPVREALNKLEAEGFVVHERHRGTFIADIGPQRVDQIYRLRTVLEPMAVRMAAERVAEEGLSAEISEIGELLRACDEAETPLEVVQRNEEFHRAVYRLSGDSMLLEFIDKLWAGVPYQSLSLYGRGERVRESSSEHHGVLQALHAGDPDTAANRMRTHIEHGRASAVSNL